MHTATVQLSYKVKLVCRVHACCSRVSCESTRTLLLLASIIIKYMDNISRLLAWHSTGNLIVMDGCCLLGH